MVNAGGGGGGGGGGGRAQRLPRWTRQEILVLIQGKRVVESRGRGRGAAVAVAVEPKWVAVSAYCQRHGVDRGAVQCRKRWSNLAGDFKKIKDWERCRAEKGGGESFWAMRNDVRRERRMPGFFDREVYDILDGVAGVESETTAAVGEEVKGADDDLFTESEDEKEPAEEDEEVAEEEERPPPAVVMPISALNAEKKSEPSRQESSDHAGMAKDKHPAEDPEKGSPSGDGHKRRRTSQEGTGDTNLQSHLIEILDRNSRMLDNHLEAQNVNYQSDINQRKEHAVTLLGVLSKLADALGRIADRL